jgi:hypothetical protein
MARVYHDFNTCVHLKDSASGVTWSSLISGVVFQGQAVYTKLHEDVTFVMYSISVRI